jgi:ATF/CREB family transcription factor
MEFQKTALSAARKSHPQLPSIGSQSQEVKPEENHINNPTHQVNGTNDQSKQRQSSDPFNADPAHNAANGLFMLAQLGNGAPGYQQAPSHMAGVPVSAAGSIESSPNLAKRAAVNNATSAVGVNNRSVSSSSVSNTVRGMSEISNDMSDSSQERDMMTSMTAGSRNAKGKNGKGKGAATSTGKRKNEDTNGGNKASNKKTKNAQRMGPGSDDGFDMEDDDDDKKDTKKMTDEEKRKNFLERNRYETTIHNVVNVRLMTSLGLLLSNVGNERNSGWQIFRPKSRCTEPRMMR